LGTHATRTLVLHFKGRACLPLRDQVAAAVASLEASAVGEDWDVLLLGALGCVNPSGRHGVNRLHAAVSAPA